MGRFLLVSFIVCVVALFVAVCCEFYGAGEAAAEAFGDALGAGFEEAMSLALVTTRGEPDLVIAPGERGHRDDIATIGTQFHYFAPEQNQTVVAFDHRGRRWPSAAYPGRPRRDVAAEDVRNLGMFSLLVVKIVGGVGITVEAVDGPAPLDVRRTADEVRCLLLSGTYTVRSDTGLSSEITLSIERVWCTLTEDGLVGKTLR